MGYNADDNPESADWIKLRSWDLMGTPEQQADMILNQGGPNKQSNLSAFLSRPAAKKMPTEVRAALRKKGYRV